MNKQEMGRATIFAFLTMALVVWVVGCKTIRTPAPDHPALSAADLPPAVDRVVLVIFENAYPEEVLAVPYFQLLTKKGAYFANYYALAHPSQPNYVALISGSLDGMDRGDSPPSKPLLREHLGNKVASSWKAYVEDLDWSCERAVAVGDHKLFARKHLPFLSFDDVLSDRDSSCDEHLANLADFEVDAGRGRLPRFSLVIPNLVHDAHDKSRDCARANRLECAAEWLRKYVGPVIEDSTGAHGDVVLFITFDENGEPWPYTRHLANKVYLVALGAHVSAMDAPVSDIYDHFDLLRTIEALLKVQPMADGDRAAGIIGGIWK